WKRTRACPSAAASTAAATAACMSASTAPATAISTNVPSTGRARRRPAAARLFEAGDNGHDPLHALGDVMRRQRGAGDVPDVAAHLQGAAARLADELCKPARAADLAAIGFAILQDLDAADASARIERDRIIDVEMLADHPVENEKAEQAPGGFRTPDAAGLDLAEGRRRKRLLLRLGNRQILHRMRGGAHRHDHRGRRGEIDPFAHQKKNPTAPRNESDSAPSGSLFLTC